MRGRFLHNKVLLAPVEARFRALGATVSQEHPVKVGNNRTGFIDLFVLHAGCRIAVEAELTPARVANDVAKARALGADILLIVVPTHSAARAIRQRLRTLAAQPSTAISVLPLGLALTRLATGKPIVTPRNVRNWNANPQKPQTL